MFKMKKCKYGEMLYNPNDDTISRCLEEYGEWSEPEIFLFSQIVRPGDVIVEIGANLGPHTVPLSQLAGESGRVYALEPQRHVFHLLCANLALNGILNVRAFHAAGGDKLETAAFPVLDPRLPNNFGAASLLEAENYLSEPISVRTIDSFGLDRVDFIKIDVEGFEMQVLTGATQTISMHRPVLHVEYFGHYNHDISKKIISLLADLEYDFWYYITPLFNCKNFFGNSNNIFPGQWSFDLLCIPKEKATVSGLVDAASVEIGLCTDPEAWRFVRFSWKS
jgi:FkbM family methyltransferase